MRLLALLACFALIACGPIITNRTPLGILTTGEGNAFLSVHDVDWTYIRVLDELLAQGYASAAPVAVYWGHGAEEYSVRFVNGMISCGKNTNALGCYEAAAKRVSVSTLFLSMRVSPSRVADSHFRGKRDVLCTLAHEFLHAIMFELDLELESLAHDGRFFYRAGSVCNSVCDGIRARAW